jgi:hypothetical protein
MTSTMWGTAAFRNKAEGVRVKRSARKRFLGSISEICGLLILAFFLAAAPLVSIALGVEIDSDYLFVVSNKKRFVCESGVTPKDFACSSRIGRIGGLDNVCSSYFPVSGRGEPG